MKNLLLQTGLIVLGIALAEGLAFVALEYILPKNWSEARKILSGDRQEVVYQNSIGQPYLLYSLKAGHGGQQISSHNSSGFRGEEVTVDKPEGTFRILFLGGSTTYGWTVPFNAKTFPQWVGEELQKNLMQKVEVINAGLPMGTSAEMLTHYLFKFRYYQPDLVVLHTGGNDAPAKLTPFYHPDYSHTRRQLIPPKQLNSFGRALLKSRIISLILVPTYFNQILPGQLDVATYTPEAPPSTNWFKSARAIDAFSENIEQLTRAILANGSKVLMIPFREGPRNNYKGSWLTGIEQNRQTLKALARKYGVLYVDFPAAVISRGNWVDGCHVNSEGAREKGIYIARQLLTHF